MIIGIRQWAVSSFPDDFGPEIANRIRGRLLPPVGSKPDLGPRTDSHGVWLPVTLSTCRSNTAWREHLADLNLPPDPDLVAAHRHRFRPIAECQCGCFFWAGIRPGRTPPVGRTPSFAAFGLPGETTVYGAVEAAGRVIPEGDVRCEAARIIALVHDDPHELRRLLHDDYDGIPIFADWEPVPGLLDAAGGVDPIPRAPVTVTTSWFVPPPDVAVPPPAPPPVAAEPFHVLVACWGNICRSPTAAWLLYIKAGAALPVPVSVVSAGVAAGAGEAMDPDCVTALREMGVNPVGHRARRLDARMIEQADLVLCSDGRVLRSVLDLAGSAGGRAFTLRELALLADGEHDRVHGQAPVTVASMRARVAAMNDRRGERIFGPADVDIPNPWRRGLGAARACAAETVRCVDAILAALR